MACQRDLSASWSDSGQSHPEGLGLSKVGWRSARVVGTDGGYGRSALKTVILAGGLGTRLREETEFKPKPMVEIGGKPILWHLMRWYAHHGLDEFVVCTGYKGEVIKDYFLNFHSRNNDVTVRLGDRDTTEYHGAHEHNDWTVTVAFTGDATLTGGRIKRASK